MKGLIRRVMMRRSVDKQQKKNFQHRDTAHPDNKSSNKMDSDLLAYQIQAEFGVMEDDDKKRQHDRRNDFENALAAENRLRNRYPNVMPYDSTRVVLGGCHSDYINASWIKEVHPTRNYIATQGPLDHTAGDFWLMVAQQKVRAIVMLTQTVEKFSQKCAQYWPDNEKVYTSDDENKQTKVELVEVCEFDDYELRKFLVNSELEVYHFYYKKWADFAVPSGSIKSFVEDVNDKIDGEDVAVVHCSAGIGRTGTYIAIDALQAGADTPIYNIVTSLRDQRQGMVQSIHQYAYIYNNQ